MIRRTVEDKELGHKWRYVLIDQSLNIKLYICESCQKTGYMLENFDKPLLLPIKFKSCSCSEINKIEIQA